MRTPSGHKVYAMAAEYPSAASLYEAAKMVRDAGFKRWDVFSPFPIHGMDEAMGLGKSWLSAVVLAGGISGLLTALLVEFGPSWGLYPLIVHGKPYDWRTVPAFFPIMFEMTVLFSAFAAVAVLGFRGEKGTNEPWEIFPDMVRQMKVRAQAPLNFFADGRGPRMPVNGTVPIGYEMPKPQTAGAPESHSVARFSVGPDYIDTGKMGNNWGTGIPVPVTAELLQRGRERFNITCAMCHGATAAGN